jgi:hypothetical protein
MPTARELLEQADALMRRNRGGDSSIPVLTESVSEPGPEASRRGPSTGDRSGAMLRVPAAPSRGARPESAWTSANAADVGEASDDRAAAPGDIGPPLLTDAVEELAIDLAPLPPERAEEDASWLGPDTIDPALHSITGPAPDTVGVVPPVMLRAAAPASGPAEEPDPTATRTFRAAGSATIPPPAGSTPPLLLAELSAELSTELPPELPTEATSSVSASEDARWNALAEQISMQVLQRLDLFVDTGLKAQLAAHLQPIVVRASAELVETINDHVGKLVRAYVAEAIEREIAQWREQQR